MNVNVSYTLRLLLQGHTARILETRKTVPGLRLLDKWAVLIGGGQNHRMGLYDMIMIKDNHIAAAGGIAAAVHGAEVCFICSLNHQNTDGCDLSMQNVTVYKMNWMGDYICRRI